MKNQESKILNKSEVAKKTADSEDKREQDAEFAQAVAEKLNKLLDEGVLTPKALGQASPEIMDEFIARFAYELAHDEKFDSYQKEKIKTTFGAREQEINESGLAAEEIKGKTRDFLKELRARQGENDPPITGAILYGSRMHSQKTPREGSDLDVVFYVDLKDDDSFLSTRAYLDSMLGNKTLGMEKLRISAFLERPAELLNLLNRKKPDSVLGLAPWILDVATFVGELPGYTEDQINGFIRDYRLSEEVKSQKRAIIDRVKCELRRASHRFP